MMTARLLPSPNALHTAVPPSELELAAHDVIWHLFRVVDALTQQADAITVADADEARAHLAHELAHFNALADEARIVKADAEWQARIIKDEADYLAAMALAGA